MVNEVVSDPTDVAEEIIPDVISLELFVIPFAQVEEGGNAATELLLPYGVDVGELLGIRN